MYKQILNWIVVHFLANGLAYYHRPPVKKPYKTVLSRKRGNKHWIWRSNCFAVSVLNSYLDFKVCNTLWPVWSLGLWIRILLYVAFRTIMAISRQKEARSQDYALLLFRMTSRVFYSAQYHRQHRTLQASEQFGALYMHNHDDKYPARPGFEPGTSRLLQAPVDTKEPSGPAIRAKYDHIHIISGNVIVSRV